MDHKRMICPLGEARIPQVSSQKSNVKIPALASITTEAASPLAAFNHPAPEAVPAQMTLDLASLECGVGPWTLPAWSVGLDLGPCHLGVVGRTLDLASLECGNLGLGQLGVVGRTLNLARLEWFVGPWTWPAWNGWLDLELRQLGVVGWTLDLGSLEWLVGPWTCLAWSVG
ncbi:hypothetical protein LAZ67_10001011 [Cordylochernes scorpioides]|uniref:Uncharacterized protein n=1 Tax=Cordylochernes scorpioides TaxID=51811 RepID=A0ABY6KY89_9ARAC|nr:hypothetical protein LAZ67_10001011 [Cordylochernes scorpioides]